MPFSNVNGINIYYEIHGKGEPLVLIYGYAGHSGLWFRQIPILSKKYQVIAFDNRGVGRSDKPDIPYTMAMMPKDIAGLLDIIGIDTAHIFAAGYDISNEEGWEATWDNFDRVLGMNRLRAVHVNDSRTGLGSNVDRHALVGRGRIGSDAFTRLVTDERTRNVPMFLETPTSAEGYAMEIAWLSAASRGEVRELPEIGEVKRGA